MAQLGYSLSSEEHGPADLVRYAQRAEDAGFEFALISDHYHPWVDRQGQSAFVWGVLGAIARSTHHLRVGTGVTCPIMRIHPAIIAQASATAAALFEGRFFLGVGAGENLNEHILGNQWPEGAVRLDMLREAIQVIRELWTGDYISHHGRYYTVEEARLYSLPDQPPPLCMAADANRAAELAGSVADGLIGTAPDSEVIQHFRSSGGEGKPLYGQLTVCWASNEKEARRTAREFWPTSGLHGNLSWELKTPRQFTDAVWTLREEDVAGKIVCGPDPEPYLEKIAKYEEAGYDHVYIHQVGPDQDGFFKFYERELAPAAPTRLSA